jgi:hypothetical protein
LDRVTGLTLTHLNIEVQEVERGRIAKTPQLVGVVPR